MNRFNYFFCLLLFFNSALVTSIFGQATFSNARHEQTDQRIIDVTFNQAVSFSGAPTTTGWSVTLNGISTPIASIFSFGSTVRITINATSVAGHTASQQYILPSETGNVRVSYNGTGNLTSSGGVTTFTNQQSQNNFVFDCSEMAFFQQGSWVGAPGVDRCVPVVMDFRQYIYTLSLRMRNSSYYAPRPDGGSDNIRIDIGWGDATFSGATPYQSLPTGTPDNTAIDDSNLANPLIYLTIRPTHNYPNSTTPLPSICSWDMFLYPYWQGFGAANCLSIGQTTIFANYDTDNANSGTLAMPFQPLPAPGITTTDRVCLGTNVNMRFTDNTLLNCRLAAPEPDVPNQFRRHIRIVYGSTNYAAPGNIPSVSVQLPAILGGGTTTVTNGTGGLTQFTPTSGAADINGVITINPPVTAATGATYMGRIFTTSTANQALGQRFYVRIDYWDVCNPYSAASPNNPAPVSIESYVELVTQPPPLTTSGLSLCYNSTNTTTGINFTVSSSIGGSRTGVNWYNTNGGSLMTNANGTNSLNFPPSSYTVGNSAVGAPFRRNLTGGAYYSVWATQLQTVAGTASGSCESHPVEVVIFQQPDISTNTPSFLTGPTNVCNGPPPTNAGYTSSAPISPKSIPVSTFTNGALVSLSTDVFWSQSFPSGVSLSASQGTSTTASFNIATQPNPSTTNNISIQLQYLNTPAVTVTSPITTGPTPYPATYSIVPQTSCPNNVANRAVTVWGQSNGGTISANQVVCEGSTQTITVSGIRGTVQDWEVQINGGGFTSLGQTTTSITPAIPIVLSAQTIYQFRALVQNGPVCASVYSPISQITVNPRPTAAVLSGNATICAGQTTNLVVNITAGTSPFTVVYSNGVTNTTVGGYSSGNNIPVSPTVNRTFTLVSVTDANGCTVPGGSLTGSAVVVVKNLSATIINVTPTALCPAPVPGNTLTLRFNIADANANPLTNYTVVYTDGFTNTTLNPYTSGTNEVITNIPSSRTFSIVSVTENGIGCTTTNSGSVPVIVGTPPSTATFAGGGSVCLNGTRNLSLTISGGVSPYTVTITPTPGVPFNVSGYTSGSPISVPTNAVGSIDYAATFITDACGAALVGSVTGNPQTIIVNPLPTANNQTPSVCSTNPGGNTSVVDLTLNNTAINPGAVTITWFTGYNAGTGVFSGPIGTPTSRSITNGVPVFARVQDGNGCVSPATVTYTVNPRPQITTQPVNTTGCDLFSRTFNVVASSPGVLSYQWRENGIPLANAGVYSGVNTATLTISNVTGLGGRNYDVVVTETSLTPNCSTTSSAATLTVNSLPSVNNQFPNVCSDASGTLTATVDLTALQSSINGSPGLLFAWFQDVGLSIPIGTPTSYLVTGGVPVYCRVTVIATGCINSAFANYTVFRKAVINTQPANVVACNSDNGITFTVVDNSFPVVTGYQWQISTNGGVSFSNQADGTFLGATYSGSATSTLTINNVTTPLNNFRYRAVLTTPGSCTFNSNSATLTVNPLPTATNINPIVCSDLPGGNTAITNLTSYKNSINSLGSTTITWWLAYNSLTRTFSSPITPGALPGNDQAYTVTNGDVIYARVIDGNSCVNVATATFTVQPKPLDNVIKDGTGAVTIASVTGLPGNNTRYDLCASNSSVLFQTDATFNPGSTFSWSIPPVSYLNEFQLITASANILVMRFQNATEGFGGSAYSITGIPITVTETLNGCTGNTITMFVHVLSSPPVSVITGPTAVCENGTATYSATGAGTFFWTIPPGATITSPPNASSINVQLSTFSGSVGVTNSNGSCTSPPATPIAVAVAPRPILTFTNNAICSGQNVNTGVALSALNVPGSNFNWQVLSISGTVTGVNVGDNATGVLNINQTPVNVSGVNATINYQVTPVGPSSTFCTGTPQIIPLVVNPVPVIASGQTKTICNNTAVNKEILLTPTTLPVGTVFSWPDPDGAGPLTGNSVPMGSAGTFHITDIINNTTDNFLTINYNITATANTCALPPTSIPILVEPTPKVNTPTNSAPVICSGGTPNISFTSPTVPTTPANLTFDVVVTFPGGGITGTGLAFTGATAVSAPYALNTGTLTNTTNTTRIATYTITPRLAGCASGTPVSVNVTVEPAPQAVLANNKPTICSGTSPDFTISSPTSPSVPANLTFDVSVTLPGGITGTGNAGSGVIGVSAGFNLNTGTLTNTTNANITVTYTVTPKLLGCTNGPTQTVNVVVEPTPVAAATNNAPTICNGGSPNFSVTSPSTPSIPGNLSFDVTVSLPGGVTASGVAGTGLTSVSAPFTLNTGVITNSTSSFQTVVYTITPKLTSCANGPTQTVNVVVEPTPAANPPVNSAPTICNGGTPNIQVTSPTNPSNLANLQFDVTVALPSGVTGTGVAANGLSNSSTPFSINSGTLTNSNNTFATVVYTITPKLLGCANGTTRTVNVIVEPTPTLAAPVNNAPVICSGGTPDFSISSPTNSTNNATNLRFDVSVVLPLGVTGTGAASAGLTNMTAPFSLNSGTLTNTNNSFATVVYTITPKLNGCPNGPTQTVNVIVQPVPQAAFTNSPSTICNGGTPNISVTSPTVQSAPATLTFDVTVSLPSGVTGTGVAGSGIVGTTAPFFINSGILTNTNNNSRTVTYTITPRISGCAAGPTQTVNVVVEPTPVAVVVNSPATICNGTTPNVSVSTPTVPSVPANLTFDVSVSLPSGVTGTLTAGTGLTNATAPFSLTGVLTNSSNQSRTVVYTITPKLNGCPNGIAQTASVEVEPTPQAVATNIAPRICSGGTPNFNVTSVTSPSIPANLTFDVTVSLPPGLTGTGVAASGLSNQTAPFSLNAGTVSNSTNAFLTAVYTITPKLNGCPNGPTQIVNVIVEPVPVVNAPVNTTPTICSGGTPNVTATSPTVSSVSTDLTFDVTVTLPSGVTGTGVAAAGLSGVNAASMNITSGTLVNSTNTFQTVVYTFIPKLNNCANGTSRTASVIVEPTPQATFVNSAPIICTGVSPNISVTTPSTVSAANAANLRFDVSVVLQAGLTGTLVAGNGGTNFTAPFSINTGVLTHNNASNGVLTATYTITPKLGSCPTGTPQVVVVSVRPNPVGAVDNKTVCSDEAFTYDLQGDNIDALGNGVSSRFTFTVSSSDETNVPTPLALDRTVATSAPITGSFTNTTNAVVQITYAVTPVSIAGTCTGAPFNVIYSIRPKPVGPAITTVSQCSGTATNFNLQTIVNNTVGGGNSVASKFRYTVTSSAPLVTFPAANRTTATTANITDVYTNLSNADVTITYLVTPVSLLGDCDGVPFTFRLVIQPEPVGSSKTDPICSTALNQSLQSQITNGVTSVFTYTVSSSDPVGVPPGPNRTVASNANITDSYNNLTGVPVTITYTVTPFSSANNCQGAQFTYAVTISAKPVGISDTKPAQCSDVAFSFDPQNNISPSVLSNFAWSATYDGSPIPSGTGVISASFTNTSNAVKNALYTITPTSTTGCVGLPFTITIPISPKPVMDPTLANPTAICSTNTQSSNPIGVILNTNGTSIAATSYQVVLKSQDFGLTGTPTTGTFAAGGGTSNAIQGDTYVNTTAAQLRVVYTITPFAGTCAGVPFDITIRVNPEPVLSNPGFPAVCSTNANTSNPINVVFGTNGTSVNADSYLVSTKQYSNGGPFSNTLPAGFSGDGGNVSLPTTFLTSPNIIRNDKYINTSNVAVTVRYTVQARSASGCVSNLLTYDIVVNPQPAFVATPPTLCSGVASGIVLNAAPTSTGINQYELKQISIPSQITAASGNAPLGLKPVGDFNFLSNDVFINTNAVSFNVTYTLVALSTSGCRGPDQTVSFTVNPAPAVRSGLDALVCNGSSAGIVLATETSPLSAAAANYTINNISIGSGLTRTAGNATFPRTVTNVSDLALDAFTNSNTVTASVTYSVIPTTSAGCSGPAKNIILTVEPTIVMNIPGPQTICSNTPNSKNATSIQLTSGITPSAGPITFNYTAAASPLGSVTGFFAGLGNLPNGTFIRDSLVNITNNVATVTYTITPVANGARNGNGCSGAPITVTVQVEPKPRLSIAPATQVICEGTPTTMTLSTTTVPGTGTMQFSKVAFTPTGGMTSANAGSKLTYVNNEQIGDIWDNPTIVAQTVSYTFRASIVGGLGCVSEDINATLTVNPRPVVTATAQPAICSGDFVNITLTPDVANTVSNFTAAAPAVISGANNGAGNLIFQTLFYNSATPTVANSDGPVTVNYTVTPRANNCNGTAIIVPVVVNPSPKILSIPARITVCHGQPLNIPLASNVNGANYTWTVDNPSGLPGIVEQPLVGASTGVNQILNNTTGSQATLTYTLKAFGPGATANQCEGEQKTVIVTVAPQITASFTNSPLFMCKGRGSDILTVQIDGQAPFSFVYNQNDGTTSTNVTVNNAGNFKVLNLSNMQATTTYTLVSVRDAFNCPITVPAQSTRVKVGDTDATFALASPALGCSPLLASFRYNQVALDPSAPTEGPFYTWQWRDGTRDITDSTFATSVNNSLIQHTFTNTSPNRNQQYNANLFVQLNPSIYPFNGCSRSNTQSVTVNSIIIPNVFPDRTDICSGGQVRLSNQTLGATSDRWFWRLPGSGLQNDVRTSRTATFTLTNSSLVNPQPIEIVYQPNNAGNCPPADVVTTINVYKGVTAGFNEGTVPPFNSGSSTVTFTNTSSPLDFSFFRYDWIFGIIGDASIQTLTQASNAPIPVTYSSPGTKEIILSATNIAAETAGLSCVSEFRKTITIILPPLQASFDVSPAKVCFPGTIKLVNVIGTGFQHDWRVLNKNTGASFSSNAANPGEFKLSVPGEYTISYRTSIASTGQVANAPVKDVSIFPLPLATFDLRPDVVFVPDTEMFTYNFSEGANQYDWDFGDGGTSILKEPVYTYKVEGKYNVTLVASFDHGNNVICRDTLKRQVTAKLGGQSKIPNAFTPSKNGPSPDGRGSNGTFNDVFLPIVRGIADEPDAYNLQIYDRWGNLIFESNSSSRGWDGYDKNGVLAPAGVYVYKLTLRFSDTQRTTQVGDVTLIR